MEQTHSRGTVIVVITVAAIILGFWTFYTQSGLMGKADSIGYAICHRIPERSFFAGDRQLPLCARCTGIYLGVMAGLGTFIASGRGRADRLPNWRVLLVMMSFVAVLGVDGLNSYFQLFPGGTGIYEPQNWLRLTTGVFTGLTLITLVLPVFNQSLWTDGQPAQAPVENLKEVAGLCLLGVLMILLTLSENATILLFLGFLSALGVLIVLSMMMTVLFVTATQHFRAYESWRALWLPMLAGLTMAITMIGLINFVRYTITGTWEGFVF